MKLSRLPALGAALVVAAGLALPATARAQGNVGVIDGHVLDQSRAAMPGVTVTAKNVATGLTRTATVQRHRDLPHRVASRRHLRRHRRDCRVRDPGPQGGGRPGRHTRDGRLHDGGRGVTETITVIGETPLVQTTKSDVGQVITTDAGREHAAQRPEVPGPVAARARHAAVQLLRPDQDRGGRHQLRRADRAGRSSSTWTAATTTTASSAACCSSSAPTPSRSTRSPRSATAPSSAARPAVVVNVITKSGTNEFQRQRVPVRPQREPEREDLLREGASTRSRSPARIDKQPFSQQQVGRHASAGRSRRTRPTSSSRTSSTAATTTRSSTPAACCRRRKGRSRSRSGTTCVTAKTDFQLRRTTR